MTELALMKEDDVTAPAAKRPRSRDARPSRATQPKIQRVDVEEISTEAAAQVRTTLEGIGDDLERLTAAVKVIDDAERKLATKRPRRDALALSLALYDGVRAVNAMAGLGRTQMSKIRRAALGGAEAPFVPGTRKIDREAYAEMAREHGIRHAPNALTALPRVATEVVRLEATAAEARKIRDDVAVALLASRARTKTEVAEIIGRNRSLVSHRLVERAGV